MAYYTPMSGTLKGNDDIALKVVFSPKQADTASQ
jgi:hypothetical protein